MFYAALLITLLAGCRGGPSEDRSESPREARARAAMGRIVQQFGAVRDSSLDDETAINSLTLTLARQRELMLTGGKPVAFRVSLVDVWEQNGGYWASFSDEERRYWGSENLLRLRVSRTLADSLLATRPDDLLDEFVIAAEVAAVKKVAFAAETDGSDEDLTLLVGPGEAIIIDGRLLGFILLRDEER